MTLGNYFNLPYKNVVQFLMTNDEALNKLSNIYNDTLVDVKDKEEKAKILADIISDDELYELGFVSGELNDDEPVQNNSVKKDEILEFLSKLDDYTLDTLKTKYVTNSLDDIATAITDYELAQLGFDIITDSSATVEDICRSDYDWFDHDCYNEDLDYLEDIPCDVPYHFLYKTEDNQHVYVVPCESDFYRFKSYIDPNLVLYCEPCDYDDILHDIYDTDGSYVTFMITPYNYYNEVIEESVVINSELNPLLFDEEHKLKPDIRNTILEYFDEFKTELANESIKPDVIDVQLIGSNAGYLYTPESDIDIHIILSQPLDVLRFKELDDKLALYVTRNPLVFEDTIVEFKFEDGFNREATSQRRYSLIENNWVDDSDENEVYTVDDLASIEGYEELVDKYSAEIADVIKNDEYKKALALKQEIRQARSDDLNEFGALSVGNVVFKELRNNGKYGELHNYIKSKEKDNM